MGARGNENVAANTATTPIAEFYGVMIGQYPRADQLAELSAMFRGYSADRRDRAPIIETEDFRDEGARRFWDDLSPPYFGFKKGPNDTYQYTSESFALASVARYWAYWQNRIFNTDPAHSKWSGYASIYFSDADADGRVLPANTRLRVVASDSSIQRQRRAESGTGPMFSAWFQQPTISHPRSGRFQPFRPCFQPVRVLHITGSGELQLPAGVANPGLTERNLSLRAASPSFFVYTQ
jgi:hypothetical protein